LAQAGLRLSDLPAHFQSAPAFIEKFIANGIKAAQPKPEQDGFTLDHVSTFVNFKETAIAIAITISLADQSAIEKFDLGLRKPDLQEAFITGFQKSLSPLGSVQVTAVKELNSLGGIGEVSRGFAMTASVGGVPMTLAAEAIALRRERTVALIILASLNDSIKGISAQDLALRLDQRLRQGNSIWLKSRVR
jgi:hypothetical protein